MDASLNEGKQTARVAAASLVGTSLEFYDHFIYGTAAALVFPKLFFSQADPRSVPAQADGGRKASARHQERQIRSPSCGRAVQPQPPPTARRSG